MNYDFQRDGVGGLLETTHNVEELRRLFLDWDIIGGDGGEGTERGDGGSWHGACHMLAAGIVAESKSGDLAWFEIAWDERSSSYAPVAVVKSGSKVEVHNVLGRAVDWANTTSVVAYVEGNSCGATSNRSADDPGNSDKDDRRQDYNRFPLDLAGEGGKVWEHWCTTRNLVDDKGPGMQALRAYLSLLCIGGGSFAATVLRGRPSYGHPAQLAGCVKSGLVSASDAGWTGTPDPIPPEAVVLYHYSDPVISLAASRRLPLEKAKGLRFFMFPRSIHLWQKPEHCHPA